MADSIVKEHHVRQELCTNRPRYREGRQLKAVKVYTVAQESRYLLVQKVPMVGATEELIKLFALYGTIEEYRFLDEYPSEEFTEVYWIKYQRIQAARLAKRKMDDHNFFGGSLHVCYAPEYETVDETKQKLIERRKEVARRIRLLESEASGTSTQSEHLPDGHSSGRGRSSSGRGASSTGRGGSSTGRGGVTTIGRDGKIEMWRRDNGDPLDTLAGSADPLQGPMLPEDVERKRKYFQTSETGDSSYDSTVHNVREAVSAFSTSLLPRCLKKKSRNS